MLLLRTMLLLWKVSNGHILETPYLSRAIVWTIFFYLKGFLDIRMTTIFGKSRDLLIFGIIVEYSVSLAIVAL